MHYSRRRFLTNTSKWTMAAGLGVTGLSPLLGEESQRGPAGFADKVRVGLIGTGGRGQGLIKVMSKLEPVDVVACCDIQKDRLEAGLKYAVEGAKGYSDYKAILDDKTIDAVVIATPLHLHFQMVRDAIDAGKHVYCEKTLTLTIEDALALEPIIKNSSKVFQVGYQHRYNPLYQKVKDIITGDEFGPLSHVECYWNRNGDWRRPVSDPKLERLINWRMYREYSGGLMAELSSHQMNIVQWITESHPIKVQGFGGIDYWKDGRETFDNIHAHFLFEDGLKVDCTCLTTNAQMGFQMKFYGKNATIQIVRGEGYQARLWVEPTYMMAMSNESADVDAVSGATAQLKQGEPILIYDAQAGHEDAEPTIHALAHFASCILDDKTPIVSYESGRDSAISVALANKAMQTSETIKWSDWV